MLSEIFNVNCSKVTKPTWRVSQQNEHLNFGFSKLRLKWRPQLEQLRHPRAFRKSLIPSLSSGNYISAINFRCGVSPRHIEFPNSSYRTIKTETKCAPPRKWVLSITSATKTHPPQSIMLLTNSNLTRRITSTSHNPLFFVEPEEETPRFQLQFFSLCHINGLEKPLYGWIQKHRLVCVVNNLLKDFCFNCFCFPIHYHYLDHHGYR